MGEMINQNNSFSKSILSTIEKDSFKHYSFDFWNTIAFSNTEFKKKRAEIVFSFINTKVSYSEITSRFEKVGAWYNIYQESNLQLISSFDLLKKVVYSLDPHVNEINLLRLSNALDTLFLKYPPYIINNLVSIIENIKNSGKTCSITSNTAFISGKIIREVLYNEQIYDKFSFLLFSNELGFSKPSYKMYDYLYLKAKNTHPQLNKSEIIHIGDNEISDYKGAIEFGIKAFQCKLQPILLNDRYALHSINDISVIPFKPIEYSKFKFGDYKIAARYGNELFEYFKNNLLPDLLKKYNSILIYSSPYAQIPTSSYYLTESFFCNLSNYLKKFHTKELSIKFSKIERCQTYTEDYGALNAEERFNLIKNDTYKLVNFPCKKDICIFIDDISITGTHQRVIEKLMTENNLKNNCIFLYYAKLSNPDICPSFENKLNYSYTSNVYRLTKVILSDSYKITTRTSKFILSLKIKDLNYLIDAIKKKNRCTILINLLYLSEANQYHKIDLYKNNLLIIKQSVTKCNTESLTLKTKYATLNPTNP